MCCQIVDQKYTAPSSGRFRRRRPLPQACGLSLRELEKQSLSYHSDLFMYFSIRKKLLYYFFFLIFDSNYFQAIETAIFFIRKTHLKYFSVILSYFQISRGLLSKTKKIKAKKKLQVEKWPQIFDRINRLGLGIR